MMYFYSNNSTKPSERRKRANTRQYTPEQLQALVKAGADAAERGTQRMNEREKDYQSIRG